MGRKTLYRSFSFTDPNKVSRLQSSISGLSAYHSGKYTVTIHGGGVCEVETNLPLAEIRAWFRASDVPMQDFVTDTMPLEERAKIWEEEDKLTAQHPL